MCPFVTDVFAVNADESAEVLVEGTVRISPGVEPLLREDTALYITVRQGGARTALNRSPPIVGVRIPAGDLTFPYQFVIRASDLYPDAPPRNEWERQTLTVSARLDTDGTASTRDPEDLVGRGESTLGNIQST
eukprot:CAMPEP_0198219142 /NCGR_PEP_ID=MMETSP1445-20131203/72776_1 /TAXON_ID=36898 /ORGANISM="Pyramimonas sp., Strain CCMP2087" /LENGTH=132 /DNA_ID=CAMNT_0043896461 /DNA_START=383 /DNA_END=778 /DNA_ORIENTATION=+